MREKIEPRLDSADGAARAGGPLEAVGGPRAQLPAGQAIWETTE
jgi:hypothetical protein